MRAVVFLNGTPLTADELNNIDLTNALVICADGAYNYLRGVITPDIILGDFDSVTNRVFPSGCEVITFPPEKDYTDGHLAVETAIERNATDIEIYGAFGGRPDHEYANLSLLYQAKRSGAVATLYLNEWQVQLCSGEVSFDASVGKFVSIVPFFESAHIISTEGLKYPMQNVTLNRSHILAISNEATAERVKFCSEGEVLLFVQK